MAYIGAAALMFVALLTFVDVICRYFFSFSLRGSQEMVEMAMPVVVYGALCFAVRTRKMISVEFVTEHLPPRVRKIAVTAMLFLCAIAMFVVTYKLGNRVMYYINGSYSTAVAGIPYTPFYIFTQLGCLIAAVEFLLNTVKGALELRGVHWDKEEKEGKQ